MKWFKELPAEHLIFIFMILALLLASVNSCYSDYLDSQLKIKVIDCITKTGFTNSCKSIIGK